MGISRLNQDIDTGRKIEITDFMDPSKARQLIVDRIVVTPQRVVVAKAIVLSACQKTASSDDLIAAVLKANDVAIWDLK